MLRNFENYEEHQITRLIESIQGRKALLLTTSNRWSKSGDTPKSTQIAQRIASETGAALLDVSSMKIDLCEGNVSNTKGNSCGLKDSALKDKEKNPSGYHRCWASYNNPDDELWKISKELFESEVVIFFVSVRWGQANSVYQKLIERLNWLENRWTTLGENNIISQISAGIVLIGHNWNGSSVITTQKQVLKFYGFQVPEELSFQWQWTKDSADESAEGYIQDPKDFSNDFGLQPVFVKEEYSRWFK
jgi:multimeric flavodoxin WrbA